MTSKNRKRIEKRKERYVSNSQTAKSQAHESYVVNKKRIISRTKQRMAIDKTLRTHNTINVLSRLENDPEIKKRTQKRAKENQKKRLQTNPVYHEQKVKQAKLNQKKRLQSNPVYHEQKVKQAKLNQKKRLQTNPVYHEQKLKRAKINQIKRYHTDSDYRGQKLKRAKFNYRQKINGRPIKQCIYNHNQSVVYARQRRYWVKRGAQLARVRKLTRSLMLQKRMQMVSSVPLLDVKLMFTRAEQTIKRAKQKMTRLHNITAEKVRSRLENLPSDSDLDHETITPVFGPARTHTASSEPYFWEQAYHVLSSWKPVPVEVPETKSEPDMMKSSTGSPIPVDSLGRAHVFKQHQPETNLNKERSISANDTDKKIFFWVCNNEICNLNNDTVKGSVSLFQELASVRPANCIEVYTKLGNCSNPARTEKLGHPVYCRLDCDCPSLLRPARILSCHFPGLRTILRRVYEVRQVALAIQVVRASMNTGCYQDLSAAVECLQNVLSDTSTETKPESDEVVPVKDKKSLVSEQLIMQQFGKALRRVIQLRDTYTTTACDVCEQLRKDLQSLRSYSCKKGFSSEKMSEIIDLLYINKTKYEDEEKFIDSIMMCRYCADKLCGNKEVARSAFNRLAVIETPDCIKELNIYERSLIKHCVTSTTIIRLGQVSNKHRPAKELNFALKGRIAYLPVNVTSNASFLPDQLLNVDSLVLLVGGQPTTKQRVWVSAVDLRKVHAALLWLRDNNKLYKDVPAYSFTDLQQIIAEKIAGIRSHAEPADDCLIKKLDEASKSHLYENFTIQPLSADYPPDAMVDYQLNKLGGLSSNVFDTELDLKAYPELFPTGENGIRDAFRKVKIGTSDFIKSRLLNKHSKFRLNISYLFHNFQVQEISNMCNSVGHMLRCVTGKAMSAKEFYDRLMAKDGEIKSKMFSLLANVRGTREYFGKLGMDVRWMLKRLGPPTFFVTCSTAEWFSDALINHLRTINSDVPNVEQMTPSELCAMDPITVSIHFHQKWDAIFTNLIRAKDTPLFGPLEDFVYRIEYQARGSAHVHALIWVKDAPVVGENSLEEVKQYIDKFVTCAKPDPTTSPTLSKLVAEFQVHKCGKYCTKVYKRNGRFARKCRFGFPRPVKDQTELNDVIDCLSVNKNKQPRKRLYHLRRESSEIYINDYNPALLLANEANVDVQFVGHAGSRLAHYICDYMTKSETTEQDALWNDIFSSAKSVGTNAMSFMLQAVRNRQVGANEAADRLLGHRLYRKSRQLRFADLQPAEKVKRVLKPAAQIEELLKADPNSDDIFFKHWVLDIYPARPDELEDMSLYDLLRWHEKAKIISNKEPLQLKGLDQHLKRRRNRPYIITHQTVNPHQSEEKKELYFYYLLKLFKPWRRESDLLHEGSTYFDTYESEGDRLPDMVMYNDHNIKVEEQQKLIEIAIKERREEQQRLQEADGLEDHETALEGCADSRADSHAVTAMQEVIDAHRNVAKQDPDSVQLNAMYQSLNADQKRVVDRIVDKIAVDEKIHLLISGQAGTGKSLVIDVINRMVSRSSGINCLSVAVTAPTGLAAFNVGGTTVHRLLCLPVEHGKPANYSRLGQDQLAVVRHTLTGLKLLIIDELSMVSSLTLLFIHLRLTEITGSSEAFGGVSVVAFADFLQLPPVKGNQPFIAVSFLEAKQRIGSIAAPDIWQVFEYEELTINMRQGGDLNYAQLLSKARIGIMSDEHHETLKERFITSGHRASVDETCDHYKQLTETGLNPIILVPRTDQCEKINHAMLTRIGNEIHSLAALDALDTTVAPQMMSKVKAAHKKMEQDTTRTAGLVSCLQLCNGAKVMLRRNKNVEAGLVNGSMGTVVSFETKQSLNETKEITKIEVKFDNISEPVFIERDSCTFEVLKNVFYTRKQFPIMLSFAITVHKAQGLSLKCAIVDAGPASFGSGMLYVALSRVTSLTGLHLIDFDPSKLVCDSKALSEYNRLRRFYTPHLGDLQEAKPRTNKNTKSHLQRTREPQLLHTVSNRKRHQSSSVDLKPDVKTAKKKRANPQPQPCVSHLKTTIRKPKQRQPSTSIDHFTTANDDTENAEIVAVTHHSIFNFCDFQSMSNKQKQIISYRLNLEFITDELMMTRIVDKGVSKRLESEISRQTNEVTSIQIHQIAGDGNCLFRSLSLGVTGTQTQHGLIRSYIVNHMMHGELQQQLEQSFQTRVAVPQTEHTSYFDHLAEMQRDGIWGTEHEIIAAAHLFDCSIVCYSRYNSTQFCLQHFSPHFLMSGSCNNTCKHPTLYLINGSGTHYNLAIVSLKTLIEE